MSTIYPRTNQHRLIANLRHAFNQSSMLGELLQNARRAQASQIHLTADETSLTIDDDGTGIADLQTLIFIAESGWSEELQSRENAFGLGVLSTLYFAEHLTVQSRGHAFSTPTASIIQGAPIEVTSCTPRPGTQIRLDGVKPTQTARNLIAWVEHQLARLCEAFPIPVWFNGTEVPRPLAAPSLQWRVTSMGKVLISLSEPHWRWRCFLQGLPIGWYEGQQVVVLPDDTLAKLPDRQHLLNEAEDRKRIQAAVDEAYREALIEAKARLAASEFVERYAQVCLDSSNADLLNDVPFAPRAWFRDWNMEPTGFRRYWDRYKAAGVVTRESLEEVGVWQITADKDDALTAEAYLEAATKAVLLDGAVLDEGHWLKAITRPLTPEQIRVRMGTVLHSDANPGLADYYLKLELVDTLHVSLAGEPEYAVEAIRMGWTLYLTPTASKGTKLVSDYVFDDRYDEDREDEDARTIATFIAVGCSSSADQVVNALLPYELRFTAQPKLAGATVRLIFDETGKLQSVIA
jgi:Histidine kinase-, DNA gyrase B-, and HSP90-like ATPase